MFRVHGLGTHDSELRTYGLRVGDEGSLRTQVWGGGGNGFLRF